MAKRRARGRRANRDDHSARARCVSPAQDEDTVVYAVAACQNVCTSYEAACAIRDGGVMERLEALAVCGDPDLEEYTKGCLKNMKMALAEGAVLSSFAEKWQSSAANTLQNAVRRWIARRRRQRMLEDAKRVAEEFKEKS